MSKTPHPLAFPRAIASFAAATLAALDGIPGALAIPTFRRINDAVEEIKASVAEFEAAYAAAGTLIETSDEGETGAASGDAGKTDKPADEAEGKTDGDKPAKRAAKAVASAEKIDIAPASDDTKPLFGEDTKA